MEIDAAEVFVWLRVVRDTNLIVPPSIALHLQTLGLIIGAEGRFLLTDRGRTALEERSAATKGHVIGARDANDDDALLRDGGAFRWDSMLAQLLGTVPAEPLIAPGMRIVTHYAFGAKSKDVDSDDDGDSGQAQGPSAKHFDRFMRRVMN